MKEHLAGCVFVDVHLRGANFIPIVSALAFVLSTCDVHASGYYGPAIYLSEGGRLAAATPEFCWELEIKRLARERHPAEARMRVPIPESDPEAEKPEADPLWPYSRFTAAQDLADFAAALREKRLVVADAELASRQHAAARAALAAMKRGDIQPLPAEADSEFADYHRGAHAFWLGAATWPEARTVWQALLARPPAERHYRSVWAAFMLGKLAYLQSEPEAVKWFELTRELARTGFADTLGFAADSYAWEGDAEAANGNDAQAADLWLTAAATGNARVIQSLRALVPSEEEDDWWAAGADPLLRKLTTIHLLCFHRWNDGREDIELAPRSQHWLGVLQGLKVEDPDGAEYLGWAAYGAGEYALAESWLARARPTPVAHWLRAKLLRRAGRLAEAAREMVLAWQGIKERRHYAPWPFPDESIARGVDRELEDSAYLSAFRVGADDEFSFAQFAGGDCGALLLTRGEFVAALEAFHQSGLWFDAAYVAEQVLTTNELKRYVDRQPPEAPRLAKPQDEPTEEPEFRYRSMRHLLGRRLVREKRYPEAYSYLPHPFERIAHAYAQALKDGANPKLPKPVRARAWFRAGWIARYAGMEIMGTEGPPDGFATRGDFDPDDLGDARTADEFTHTTYLYRSGEFGSIEKQHPTVLRATSTERRRLQSTAIQPNVRFHYRIIGARLMMKAAALLPDHSPELADVINRAGWIVREMDHDLAERWFQEMEHRCEGSELGDAAIANHWFLHRAGPWSTAENTALETMLEKSPPKPGE